MELGIPTASANSRIERPDSSSRALISICSGFTACLLVSPISPTQLWVTRCIKDPFLGLVNP
nr:MAG TPA: hypothetical protein [Caudoviricetes sp.]